MAAPMLAEGTVTLIIAHLKANLPGALADVRAARNDAKVSTEPPRSYFTIDGAKAYQAPAVFVRCEQFDFRQAEKQSNHISALAKVYVNVVVEDRDKSLLLLKCWRYQSALHEVLANTQLTSSDSKVKLSIVVINESFSPMFSSVKTSTADAEYRQEVALECDVNHWENF